MLMIQRREHPRFTLESCNTFAIMAECFWKEFDRNPAAELGNHGLINIPPCRPDPRCDVIS
jgi:hypothetical protein